MLTTRVKYEPPSAHIGVMSLTRCSCIQKKKTSARSGSILIH